MELYQYIIFASLVITIVGESGLMWFLLQQQKKVVAHWFLLVHIVGVMGWTLSIFLLLITPYTILASCTFAFAMLLAIAKYLFTLAYPIATIRAKYLYVFSLLPGVYSIILSFIPGALFTNVVVVDGYYMTLENGPKAGIYALTIMYYLIAPMVILMKKIRTTTNTQLRSQLQFLLYGISIFFVIGFITNSILPVFFSIYNFNALGPVFSLILTGFIIHIITQYQFLDLRIVVQRGLIYTAIFAFVILVYSVVLAITSALFSVNSIMSDTISCLLVTIFALITVPHIDTRLRKLTDPIFFKDRYDYEEVLLDLSRAMQETLDMNKLLSKAEQQLENILKANLVRIEGPGSTSKTDDLYIPIKLQDELVGNIIIGDKKSGEQYSTQDIRLLRTFARQAAIAIGRVLLYQEVQKRAEVLEERVQERTQTLQTMQERQKSMMLQLSHNLQTPLAILQTKIETLRNQPGMHDTAISLGKSLKELSDFMSDLLHYARLDNQQETFSLEEHNLSELIEELSEEITIIADVQNIEVRTDIKPGIMLRMDKRQMREAFMNILSNAIKYIGVKNPRSITIGATADATHATITFSDTGVGIATKDLERIFDQFYRPNDTVAKGTGLGLAITKKIIEHHGGTATVTSEVGTGSTFTITLPIG